MTANQIVNAYRAVHELKGLILPYKAARAVAKLKKKLDEEMQVIIGMEQAIVQKHGGKTKPNGSYDFDTPDAAAACKAELDGFNGEEVEVELPVVDLTEFVDQVSISPAAIEALEGIVLFEGSE
ncbi:MAG: hypothetical protein IKK50_06700 [Ruminiclostridium sp.]|nr:hypothetical protein [Ruminiclostridium sp.]